MSVLPTPCSRPTTVCQANTQGQSYAVSWLSVMQPEGGWWGCISYNLKLMERVPGNVHRVYADTSVFGGAFDDEFREASCIFLEQAHEGRFALVTSAAVQAEMTAAPPRVRELFEEMVLRAEVADITDGALRLQRAYLAAGVVSVKWSDDALHVAIATVAGCSALVSWNFRHLVHMDKIPLYNAVNKLNRYPEVAIHSPLEVIQYEEESL